VQPLPFDIEHALAVAVSASVRARLLVEKYTLGSVEFSSKPDGSPVTLLDKEVELAIRAVISNAFPEHTILGEEFPPVDAGSEHQWIIDPIDGTVSLVNRIPTYATLIALCSRGLPIASVVDLHALGHRYTAATEKGAWCDSSAVHVSHGFNWSESVVCHGDRHTFESSGYLGLYEELSDRIRFYRSYTDAFGHSLVASGGAAAMVDSAMEPWDLAAPMLLVQEAGGEVVLYRDLKQPRRFLAVTGNARAVEAIRLVAAALGYASLPAKYPIVQ
jgi:histidinol-phosphatase